MFTPKIPHPSNVPDNVKHGVLIVLAIVLIFNGGYATYKLLLHSNSSHHIEQNAQNPNDNAQIVNNIDDTQQNPHIDPRIQQELLNSNHINAGSPPRVPYQLRRVDDSLVFPYNAQAPESAPAHSPFDDHPQDNSISPLSAVIGKDLDAGDYVAESVWIAPRSTWYVKKADGKHIENPISSVYSYVQLRKGDTLYAEGFKFTPIGKAPRPNIKHTWLASSHNMWLRVGRDLQAGRYQVSYAGLPFESGLFYLRNGAPYLIPQDTEKDPLFVYGNGPYKNTDIISLKLGDYVFFSGCNLEYLDKQ